jgi:hypothetical protein
MMGRPRIRCAACGARVPLDGTRHQCDAALVWLLRRLVAMGRLARWSAPREAVCVR